MNTLYAGPWVGEFGWELFCWHGHIRYLKPNYKKVVVACRAGHEVLYEDFADEIFSLDISCEETDMWTCKNYKVPSFEQIFKCRRDGDWMEPNKPFSRYDHRHILDTQPLFNNFKKQKYFKYGNKSKGYDIIWHARKTEKSKTGYRNWPVSKWKELTSFYKNKKTTDLKKQQPK